MKLSIIIPCYNAEPYIHELLKRLDGQMSEDIEVIVIDDGSKIPFKTDYKWAQVIRQSNGGAGKARNAGLDKAKGDYIAFIDADDLVAENYTATILDVIEKENPNYIYLSWKTLKGGWSFEVRLKSVSDTFPPFNLCVWNRVYKRSMIGNVRFNEKKLIAEDAEFIRDVKEAGKKAIISEFMYFYRDTPESLTKRFAAGQIDSKRIVYYYPKVTKDMAYLVKEFKEADRDGEVILMTNQNDIPELSKYAMITKPMQVKGTELRGEPTNLYSQIPQRIKTQVVIWTHATYEMGGIETFIYAFCRRLHEYYDIMVLYDVMDARQIARLSRFVEVRKAGKELIECDTLIVNRIIDPMPKNVIYKQTIQMVHGVKHGQYHVPQDKDIIVSVSDAVKDSFGKETKDSKVIRNMTYIEKPKKDALLLVSTSRLDCADKGEARMVKLARMMENAGINYVWLCFTNKGKPNDAPSGMVYLKPTLNILSFVKKADFLVQLSDHEAFCYSIVEALEMQTPIIATPLDVLEELGVQDGINGYIVPFDMDFDVKRLLRIPKFKYSFDNDESIRRWREVLGDTIPTHSYKPNNKILVEVTKGYMDMELNRNVKPGEVIETTESRARLIIDKGFGKHTTIY